jgi:hypothetical protein
MEDVMRSLPQYALSSTDECISTQNGGIYLPILYNKRKLQVLQQETIPFQQPTVPTDNNESRFCVRYRIKIIESNVVFDFINIQFSSSTTIAKNEFTHLLQLFEDSNQLEYPLLAAGDLNLSTEQYPAAFATQCTTAGSARDHQIFVWKGLKGTRTVHTTYEYELITSPIIPGIPKQAYTIETGNTVSRHDCLLSRILLQIESN